MQFLFLFHVFANILYLIYFLVFVYCFWLYARLDEALLTVMNTAGGAVRVSMFFRSVAPGRLPILQWVALSLCTNQTQWATKTTTKEETKLAEGGNKELWEELEDISIDMLKVLFTHVCCFQRIN